MVDDRTLAAVGSVPSLITLASVGSVPSLVTMSSTSSLVPNRRRQQHYLGSIAQHTTEGLMALASSILNFEILEIWTESISTTTSEPELHCTYVHAEESFMERFPEVISGYAGQHKKEHRLSPSLCGRVRGSTNGVHWRVVDDFEGDEKERIYDKLSFPLKTEMSFCLEEDEEHGTYAYIVGFSIERVRFKPSKLKFLSGLAMAIVVAAFDLDDTPDTRLDGTDGALEATLSGPTIGVVTPRPIRKCVLNYPAPVVEDIQANIPLIANHDAPMSSAMLESFSLVDIASESGKRPHLLSAEEALSLADYHHPTNEDSSNDLSTNIPPTMPVHVVIPEEQEVLQRLELEERARSHSVSTTSITTEQQFAMMIPTVPLSTCAVPTWHPAMSFSFPIAEIPVKHAIRSDLTLQAFTNLRHLADGSNSNIFLAYFGATRVIIKMLSEAAAANSVALQEFDTEFGTLARLNHPHIISILGGGRAPRPFLVLEFLGGGSLNRILQQYNRQDAPLTDKLFRKPTFTYATLLQTARDLAEALDYLHNRCHPGAAVVHRDLKPDNIGFTAEGTLKLFDFGLATVIKTRSSADEAYEMTGFTGSLRYMAPEVVLRKPYSERADVHSFGILLWQMARDRVPFKGLSKTEFIKVVVEQGDRPKLEKSWPTGFSELIRSCWAADPTARPSFGVILMEINKLIQQELDDVRDVKMPLPRRGKNIAGADRSSSWF